MALSFGLSIPFLKKPHEKGAEQLYVALVEQARAPRLYAELGVEDTLDGRFDLISLYVLFMIRRARLGEGQGIKPKKREEFAQALFDAMLLDFDRNLREMGVGDLSIDKRMKKIGAAVYGRAKAYDEAMASGDSAVLAETLRRNLYREREDVAPDQIEKMCAHVIDISNKFSNMPLEDLMRGSIALGDSDEQ